MNPSQIFVFEKMCSYIPVNIKDINFSKHDWYNEYCWDKDEEEDFRDWLINEVRVNNKLRKELSNLPYRPKYDLARKFANEFIFMWGWRTRR